jgi:hypothetical protein
MRLHTVRTPYDFNGALTCFDLTLQRWWEGIFGWKPNPRSRWKRAASNGFLRFATLDVIALLSLQTKANSQRQVKSKVVTGVQFIDGQELDQQAA